MDPGLELGTSKGFEEDPCEILILNSRITQKKYFYHTEKKKKIFKELLTNSS